MTRPTVAGISEWAGQAAQITTGVAGLSYAFGWVLMARFYGTLGVEPEDVGITFTWLVARAFLVGLLALTVLLVARWLQSRATAVRSTDLVLSVGTEVRSLMEVRLPLHGRHLLRGVAGALVGFVVVSLLVLPFRLGDRFATDARAGKPVDFGLLGMSAIRVTRVRLASADPAEPPPAAGCVLRLGSNAGTSLFVVEGHVMRLSDQNVTVSSPC
ncbi:hypothetical protein [Streptosporangium roseum]|uniref:Uncharacterized protein n=1 Tax=Streptosporangium roseum (strain ATCC 12428 / DSM 43021 / JCM 3005 / KCTC 9067 / NCIMB 10171 / NRRL 2505 / NI 9100) TaxID=479432 RepID=D2AQW7_STRRD|nr:hypothetical protein [Streptosporangium roseum]ACZ86514.1 hypothetical protein Sros_3580 [Streptosporangium roseum DSM 43021]